MEGGRRTWSPWHHLLVSIQAIIITLFEAQLWWVDLKMKARRGAACQSQSPCWPLDRVHASNTAADTLLCRNKTKFILAKLFVLTLNHSWVKIKRFHAVVGGGPMWGPLKILGWHNKTKRQKIVLCCHNIFLQIYFLGKAWPLQNILRSCFLMLRTQDFVKFFFLDKIFILILN